MERRKTRGRRKVVKENWCFSYVSTLMELIYQYYSFGDFKISTNIWAVEIIKR
jgi:hypothetical protein